MKRIRDNHSQNLKKNLNFNFFSKAYNIIYSVYIDIPI
jgi:hypothetical protein